MRRTIWKYELAVTDVQHVEMPSGAQLLHVARQESQGNPAPVPEDNAVYVGTAQCPPYVWHVFDGGEVAL